MITGLIIALFLIQLITIFMVVLLYSKLSKFKDLENRQNQLVNEMDNAIGVYLMEMKEENDRLISELKNTSSPLKVAQVTEQPQFVSAKQVLKEVAEEVAAPKQVESSTTTDKPELEPRKYVPVKLAANAYSKQKAANVEETSILLLFDDIPYSTGE